VIEVLFAGQTRMIPYASLFLGSFWRCDGAMLPTSVAPQTNHQRLYGTIGLNLLTA
jgi:hypothetical protein